MIQYQQLEIIKSMHGEQRWRRATTLGETGSWLGIATPVCPTPGGPSIATDTYAGTGYTAAFVYYRGQFSGPGCMPRLPHFPSYPGYHRR